MIDLSNTDVILLSAGTGKRLGKIGKIKPKSLIKIKNETLLIRIIKILAKRKATKISVMVGYKSQKIKKELKKMRKIQFKFIKVKEYQKYGHSYTWYLFNKFWNKKNNLLLLHTDIIFNKNILDNILKSNIKDIIGIQSTKIHKPNVSSFVVQTNNKNIIKRIDHPKNLKKYSGIIIGINKISASTMKKIFKYMKDKFKSKNNRKLNWENIIDMFINEIKPTISALPKQTASWVNINKVSDLNKAKKIFQ
jgi:choline kinase